jgi:hypothetical protein
MAVAALIAQVAMAQQGMPPGERVSGTVKSVAADNVVLTTPKGEVTIALTPQTRVMAQQKASSSDIKPGSYVATANQDGKEPNTGTSTELRVSEGGGRGVNRPMNDSGLTMTNGNVKSVTRTAAGQVMDVEYEAGKTRRVTLPDSIAVQRMVTLDMTALKPGVSVNAMTSKGADGKDVANMIQIDSAGAQPRP